MLSPVSDMLSSFANPSKMTKDTDTLANHFDFQNDEHCEHQSGNNLNDVIIIDCCFDFIAME